MTQLPHRDRAKGQQRDARADDDGLTARVPLKFQSDGWQVSNIDEHAQTSKRVMLSKLKGSAVQINCYEPGMDGGEMHCHPSSEHTFLVWKGLLRVRGVEPGEDLTLGPGDFVQIKAGYYYQLHNPGSEPAVYCQFRTVPAKPAKVNMVFFSESRRGKQAAAG